MIIFFQIRRGITIKLIEIKEKIINSEFITNISKDIFPYQLEFLADPFLYKGSTRESCKYYLFLEVFKENGDKRIALLRSDDLLNWKYKNDIIKKENVSYPYIYMDKDNYKMVPCIRSKSGSSRFINLETNNLDEDWSIKTDKQISSEINDRVMINLEGNFYLLYGSKSKFLFKDVASLNFKEIVGINDNSKKVICIKKKSIIEKINQELLNKPTLTYRPAGDILYLDDKKMILPIQATKTGKYGELIALCEFKIDSNNIKYKDKIFISADEIDNDFTRFHHISMISEEKKIIFAIDYIIDNKWGVQILESKIN